MKFQMSQTSPIVPIEPQIIGVPIFPGATSSLDFAMDQLTSRSLRRRAEREGRGGESKSLPDFTQSSQSICQCPHILVADDDPFQAFFYETLFLQSISWEEILENKQDSIKYELCSSGEELLQKYQRIQACGCGRVALVISDYSMGPKRLNGIDTILALRKKGYSGPVILRTSEEREDLVRAHQDFDELLSNEVINNYVKKQSFKEAKEVIKNHIRKL